MQRACADGDAVVDVVGLADVVGRLVVLLTTKRCLSDDAMKTNKVSISMKWKLYAECFNNDSQPIRV